MALLVHTQVSFPFQYFLGKLDQKDRLPRPHLLHRTPIRTSSRTVSLRLRTDAVGRDAGGEPGAVTHALDHARDVGGTVELGHLAGHADVGVDEGFVVDNHVLVRGLGVARLLEAVGLAAKEVCPHLDLDEVEEGDDIAGPQLAPGRFAV